LGKVSALSCLYLKFNKYSKGGKGAKGLREFRSLANRYLFYLKSKKHFVGPPLSTHLYTQYCSLAVGLVKIISFYPVHYKRLKNRKK
jgi:hypothetical protein